jgi:hypothetical protein
MIGYDNTTQDFIFSTGVLFLLFIGGFLCLVVILRALVRRIKTPAHDEKIGSHLVPAWITLVIGIISGLGGICGVWIGIVPGLMEQTLFTRTSPEMHFNVFEPLGFASIVFGSLLMLFSICVSIMGILMVIEALLRLR